MAHYFNMPAILQEINRVRRVHHESVFYGIWNAILSLQFSVQNGYIVRPQDQHSSQSGVRGYSDLHVFHYAAGANSATKFLIVQCKRAGLETQPAVWEDGVEQLLRYTVATHGTRPVQSRRPVYGIVAIGKTLRFYVYNEARRRIQDLNVTSPHPEPARDEPCHLWHHRRHVQFILDYIRTNH